MSNKVRESSTFDKLPRLVFLGGSGGIAIFTIMLISDGVDGVAAVGAIGALFMWFTWLVLFCVQTGRAERLMRWVP